jgi:hypothetical protein
VYSTSENSWVLDEMLIDDDDKGNMILAVSTQNEIE